MASLKSKIMRLDCKECQVQLPDYVHLELTQQAADAIYPAVAFHLATCRACEAAYWREFDAQGMMKSLPELQQVGRRAGVAHTLEQIINPPAQEWWQRIREQLHRLVIEVPVFVAQTKSAFGDLPAAFAPQLAPASGLRLKRSLLPEEANEPQIELVRFHPPQADLEIALSVALVADYKSTLVVWVKILSTGQPVAQDRVTLRTETGSLLEMLSTDGDGLALFQDLVLGRYLIQVAHAGQTWEFVTPLNAWQAINKT